MGLLEKLGIRDRVVDVDIAELEIELESEADWTIVSAQQKFSQPLRSSDAFPALHGVLRFDAGA